MKPGKVRDIDRPGYQRVTTPTCCGRRMGKIWTRVGTTVQCDACKTVRVLGIGVELT